ncbi:MAG: MerR family DNA-binding transcriptional regulator [Kiloniellales bacterium]|nr:MerR family DNA-binding transcriptional regulator [Kiloniellales bacterium]
MPTSQPRDINGPSYSIGELAKEFGITTRTIRFYEDEGLLSPRRQGQQRVFSPRERTRLKLILRGKRLGFPLSEIAEIVDLYDQALGERGQLETLIQRIESRQHELHAKRTDIDASLADLEDVKRRCRQRLKVIAD